MFTFDHIKVTFIRRDSPPRHHSQICAPVQQPPLPTTGMLKLVTKACSTYKKRKKKELKLKSNKISGHIKATITLFIITNLNMYITVFIALIWQHLYDLPPPSRQAASPGGGLQRPARCGPAAQRIDASDSQNNSSKSSSKIEYRNNNKVRL